MSTFDIVIGIFLILGIYRGYKKGLFMELISILAFLFAIIGALKLLDFGILLLEKHFPELGSTMPVLAFILLFIAILIGVTLLGKLIKKIIDLTPIGSLDNLAGALVGLIKWSLGISFFLWGLSMLEIQLPEEYTQDSFLFSYIQVLAPELVVRMSTWLPFLESLVENVKNLF